QREIHEDTHRPDVSCDFPVIHSLMYLRIKNYGNTVARNIRVTVDAKAVLPTVAGLQHPISFLAPDDELLYWLYGPQEYHLLPSNLTLDVNYLDIRGRQFELKQEFDFAYLGIAGGGGRGLD